MTVLQAQPPERPKHRYLTERIFVTGVLELTSPAHFGNGDADELTDLPLLIDELDGRALVTGASLAGAVRNYLRERQWGYELPMPSRDPQSPYYRSWNEAEGGLLATTLFGAHRSDDIGTQSPLIVDDAFSTDVGSPDIELRDGVKIDAATRTAEDQKKYDYQLLRAGTCFNLSFELLLDDNTEENRKRKQALALALQGLADGEIRLGAKKRRGFGCCRVARWKVTSYNLRKPDDLFAWLATDYTDRNNHESGSRWRLDAAPKPKTGSKIATLLSVELTEEEILDRRDLFEIEGDFEIDGSLMVRGGFDQQDCGSDVVHFRTRHKGEEGERSVLPGTSIAGAIRHRALRIANTVARTDAEAKKLIGEMFGAEDASGGAERHASRVLVNEQFIRDGRDLVQTRIRIDRFTGGTIESAIVEEAPHFGGKVRLGLSLRNPKDCEIGLLLLVLKDLWLGDLPVGGEASIGRGRLRGVIATLGRNRKEIVKMSNATHDGTLSLSDEAGAAQLETYVKAFSQWAEGK
jgi:CRISPR/Cas system CSM-associated protein Csm3 (group 7 of RAMP superfamily)